MKLADFDYPLPKELIAQEPIEPRDRSSLLVLDRKTGEIIHRKFFQIVQYLTKNDVLVFNDTKVIPARLMGKKESGGHQEILLTRPANTNDINQWPDEWLAIGSPALKTKQVILFDNGLKTEVIDVKNRERIIRFNKNGTDLRNNIFKLGQTPLPPYIKYPTEKSFKEYQTIYAQKEGSIAAPTAGFHFTKDLIEKLKDIGVELEYLTLHVGLGTFMPIKSENIEEHKMHSEYFQLDEEVAQRLNMAKTNGKRIVSVGTTTTRVLESCLGQNRKLKVQEGWTNIFIYPGYQFKFVDALITNFHLPKSTLLMLVCAFASKELIFKAYQEAIKKKYRFYSFGDAMFIQ